MTEGKRESIPPAGAAGRGKKLTVGMATYDDYSGVFFTASSIRLHHPEVTDLVDILVVDNNPWGDSSGALKMLEEDIEGFRYFPVDDIQSSTVKDRIFREADSDWVLCVDSHVLLAPGALQRLLDFIERNPDCQDLLQGPLLRLDSHHSSMSPEWLNYMHGAWYADSGTPGYPDPDGDPFEIELQGLGLFACRRDSWLGYNPLFRAHGGEEGYIHHKYRSAGRKILSLPFLAWRHRFNANFTPTYPNTTYHRLRNHLIGWEELGLPLDDMISHFRESAGDFLVKATELRWATEKNNPLSFFRILAVLNPGRAEEPWQRIHGEMAQIAMEDRLRRVTLPEADDTDTAEAGGPAMDEQVQLALSHRYLIARAVKESWSSVLIVSDQARILPNTLGHLAEKLEDLADRPWGVLSLSAWPGAASSGSDSRTGRDVPLVAVAYSQEAYSAVLEALPEGRETARAALENAGGSFSQLLEKILHISSADFPFIEAFTSWEHSPPSLPVNQPHSLSALTMANTMS